MSKYILKYDESAEFEETLSKKISSESLEGLFDKLFSLVKKYSDGTYDITFTCNDKKEIEGRDRSFPIYGRMPLEISGRLAKCRYSKSFSERTTWFHVIEILKCDNGVATKVYIDNSERGQYDDVDGLLFYITDEVKNGIIAFFNNIIDIYDKRNLKHDFGNLSDIICEEGDFTLHNNDYPKF